MPMEISTLVNSIKIELMVLEYMFIRMGRNMKGSGKVICKMVQGKKNWKMEASMMVCSNKVKKTVRGRIDGLITVFILGIGKIIILKEKVNILGQI